MQSHLSIALKYAISKLYYSINTVDFDFPFQLHVTFEAQILNFS